MVTAITASGICGTIAVAEVHGRKIAALTELERKIVNALQIHPRASWTLIGEVLGVDPDTAARAWAGLTSSGRAWMSANPGLGGPGSPLIAFIEVNCRAGSADAVAQELVPKPRVLTIEHTSGGRDLLLTVIVVDLVALSRLLRDELGATDGVIGTRVHIVTATRIDGSDWRLRALDAATARRLAADRPAAEVRPERADHRDHDLIAELLRDGRAGFTDLAERTGMSVSTARRRAHRLLASGAVVLLCEVAQPLSGWPVSGSIWCRVPPARLDAVLAGMAGIPEVRVCAAITGGPTNMFASLWLRSAGDLQRLEALLGDRVPDLETVDRAVALVHIKRMGRVLDDDGCAVGHVPVSVS